MTDSRMAYIAALFNGSGMEPELTDDELAVFERLSERLAEWTREEPEKDAA